MVSGKVTVINPSGLHLRPAGTLTQIAMKCDSDIVLIADEKTVDPKSILNLMSASITCGTSVTVRCEGKTEVDDLKTIVEAIKSGLGEN
ncbi:HPr family phosphocarrier protein [Anaerotalea alkaliphila]|uniref:HPr family phosphocarrier protein n=1 Tax=Anaerotalea alkaliphila TaxID=2662126 RepID=A0A7X5HWP2_9FIRM|nr:HPr family phosphocarrier protein [Anaerotalea alkaliphila]NDL67856.1 HPr family phosphocarrier protein [Anaerotalea alkaliphila]